LACLEAKTTPIGKPSESNSPKREPWKQSRIESAECSRWFSASALPFARRVVESAVANDCNRLVVSSGKAQSPSIGSMCLRKCDSAVFRVLGFKVSATCSSHSRITALSVAVLLGTGDVAPLAAFTECRMGWNAARAARLDRFTNVLLRCSRLMVPSGCKRWTRPMPTHSPFRLTNVPF